MLNVATWVQHSIDSHPFRSMSIELSIPEIQNFLNLTLKIQGEGEMAMMMHNYRSRQFHIISNGINPSSGFHWLPQSLAHVLPHWTSFGANGQITMTVNNYKSRHVHKTLNGLNPPRGFRDQHSANFSEIRIRIQNFPFMKMQYRMLSAIWWQFSPGWDQLNSFYLMGHPGEEATQCAHKFTLSILCGLYGFWSNAISECSTSHNIRW